MAVTQVATKTDYSSRAKAKIRKSRDRPLSVLVYGRYKKGKTHFCTTAGNVLIVDPENGTDNLTKVDPDVFPVERWEDFDDLYKYLKSGDHSYDYVAFDGMTRFSNMALRYVMSREEETNLNRKPGMVQLQDYGKAGELMKGLMYNFHPLPIGKIYTAQEKRLTLDQDGKKVFLEEDDEADEKQVRLVPEMPDGTRSAVNALVDVIGRIYTVRKESERTPGRIITQRRLWIAQSSLYDTGFRSDYRLPDYLSNPSVPKLTELIKNGKVDASNQS
ncbi:MAG: ATP-binding protein [Actinobacteria bacterium]|nr:ATP-binding protein [Actinomycetota bacterium]